MPGEEALLRVLIVEDSPEDAELIRYELNRAGFEFRYCVVENKAAFLKALTEFKPQLVLSDYLLPAFNGREVLELVKARYPEIPVIVVTGSINEETAVDCVKAGAVDYVTKEHLGRLVGAVRGALATRENLLARKRQEELQQRHTRLLQTINMVAEWLLAADQADESFATVLDKLADALEVDRAFIYRNETEDGKLVAIRVISRVRDKKWHSSRRPPRTIVYLQGLSRWRARLSKKQIIAGSLSTFPGEESKQLESWDVTTIVVLPVFQSNKWWGFLGFALRKEERNWEPLELQALTMAADVLGSFLTRLETQRALQTSEQRIRHLLQSASDAIIGIDEKQRVSLWNRAATKLFGYTAEETLGKDLYSLIVPPEYLKQAKSGLTIFYRKGTGPYLKKPVELQGLRKDGDKIPIELSIARIRHGTQWHALAIVRDISERKAAEKEIRSYIERLEGLNETGALLVKTLNPREVAEIAVRRTAEMFNTPYAVLFRYDSRGKVLLPMAFSEGYKGILDTMSLKPGQGFSGKVFKQRKGRILNRSLSSDRTDQFPDSPSEPASLMSVPLLGQNECLGVLTVSRPGEREFTAEDLEFLTHMAQLVTAALFTARLHEEVERSAEDFRQLIETAVDPIITIDNTGKIILWNPAAEKLFGYSRQEIIGRKIGVLFVHRHRYQQLMNNLRRFMRIGYPAELESSGKATLRSKNGEQLTVIHSVAPRRDPRGHWRFTMILKDITELIRAQQEIERLAYFPKENPMPVVEIDCRTKEFTYINPAGEKLLEKLGFSREDMALLLPPNYEEVLESALHGHEVNISAEVDVGQMTLLWTGHLLKEPKLVHFYATDITEIKRAREELIKAKERAERSEEVKSLFLANMSHEIRTPLNSILGFTDLIHQSLADRIGPEEKEFFEIVRNSGLRLMRTVHAILDISQIEAGVFEVKPVKLNLEHLIKVIMKEEQPAAEEKNLEMRFVCEVENPEIIADEYCITQSFSHLINNAVKYTPEGWVEIRISDDEDHYIVTIQDTGIGISQEYLGKLFEAFSQESSGYTKRFQGVGLGLALTKNYLDLNGVEIEVESQKAKGTTFTLLFPKPRPEKITEGTEQTEENFYSPIQDIDAARRNKPLILVVEDDEGSRRLVNYYLREQYRLEFADTVEAAKKILNQKPVRAVLLDLSLAGDQDGLALVDWCRSQKRWKDLPIIATTAHAFTSDRDNCLESGCTDYLSKPLKRQEVIKILKKYVDWGLNKRN